MPKGFPVDEKTKAKIRLPRKDGLPDELLRERFGLTDRTFRNIVAEKPNGAY